MKALKLVLFGLLGFAGYFAGKSVVAYVMTNERMQSQAERGFEQIALTRKNFKYMQRYFPKLYSDVKYEFGNQLVEYCKTNQCGENVDQRAIIEIAAKSNQKIVRFLKANLDKLGSFADENISLVLESALAEHKYVRSAHGAKACQVLSVSGQIPMYTAFPQLNKDTKLRDHTDNTVALLLQAIFVAGKAAKPRPSVLQRDYELAAAQYQKLGGDLDTLANIAKNDADPDAVCKSMITYLNSIKELNNPEKRRLSLELVAALMGDQ